MITSLIEPMANDALRTICIAYKDFVPSTDFSTASVAVNVNVNGTQHSLVLFMKTRIGVMSCGTAGPLGSVPGMWNHLQGDQVN